MKFNRIAFKAALALVVFALAFSGSPVFAAMGQIDSFALSNAADKDLAGSGGTVRADGKPDAEFSVRISGAAGAISGFTLKNLTAGQEWNTSGAPNVLVAVDSKGRTVNSSFPRVAFFLAAAFNLYANDRAAITASGGDFELTAHFVDGSASTGKITLPGTAAATAPAATAPSASAAAAPAGGVKIISSSFLGRGGFDLTNETKNLGSNMTPDYRIDVSLAGTDTLTGVRIRSTGGGSPDKLWDTVPTTGNPFVAVSEQGKGTPLNAADGSVSLPVKDLRDLSLWFDGDDNVQKQNFRLTLLYTGGRIEETDIRQTNVRSQAGNNDRNNDGSSESDDDNDRRVQRNRRPTPRLIVMKARPVQIKLDVVGKNRSKQASRQNDFSFMLNVRGDGVIEDIAVENLIGGKGKWDTVPGSKAWLTLVRKGGSQVNDPKDFSLSVPVSGSDTVLELLMENDGSLGARRGRLKVTVTWDDGETTEETLTW